MPWTPTIVAQKCLGPQQLWPRNALDSNNLSTFETKKATSTASHTFPTDLHPWCFHSPQIMIICLIPASFTFIWPSLLLPAYHSWCYVFRFFPSHSFFSPHLPYRCCALLCITGSLIISVWSKASNVAWHAVTSFFFKIHLFPRSIPFFGPSSLSGILHSMSANVDCLLIVLI